MRTIPLTRGLVATVDDEDYATIVAFGKWCALASRSTFYAVRGARREAGGRTTVAMHSVLTGWPLVDHIDGDGLNNTRANLRQATKSENARNSRLRSDNTCGFRGVALDRRDGRWQAKIQLHGRTIYLGRFLTPAEAARAYDAAAIEVHGDFATLNFPTGRAA